MSSVYLPLPNDFGSRSLEEKKKEKFIQTFYSSTEFQDSSLVLFLTDNVRVVNI